MIKRITFYELPPGTDSDEFWAYQKGPHAKEFLHLAPPGLKKYVVDRITKVVRGEVKIYGYSETWWDSEAAMQEFADKLQAERDAGRKVPLDDFSSRVTGFSMALVEEAIIYTRR